MMNLNSVSIQHWTQFLLSSFALSLPLPGFVLSSARYVRIQIILHITIRRYVLSITNGTPQPRRKVERAWNVEARTLHFQKPLHSPCHGRRLL